jgi:hypothetical protein
MTPHKITVLQVFRSMGIEPDDKIHVSVGLRVALTYLKEVGEQPPKENRTKKCGIGVHCFAVYPPSWKKRIEEIIKEQKIEESKQIDFFSAGILNEI